MSVFVRLARFISLIVLAAGLSLGAPAPAAATARVTPQCLEEIAGLAVVANLRYLTRSDTRLPTLYFVAPNGMHTVRIRQEHGSGPLVKAYPGPKARFRLFYRDAADQQYLREQTSGLSAPAAEHPDRFSAAPVAGWHQVEYSTTDNRPGGTVRSGRHFSGGVVSLDISGYTQEAIDDLIAGIEKKECSY